MAQTVSVPFGTDRLPSLAASGALPATPTHHAVSIGLGEGGPLRICDAAAALFAHREPKTIDDPVVAIRDQVSALCDEWHRPAFQFVDAYFAALEASLVRDKDAVLAHSIDGGMLYELRDWIYLAPCPLPRAHLLAPDTASHSGKQLIKVDFAFWTGRNFVVVDFGRSRLLPRALKERERSLRDAGVDLLETIPADEGSWSEFLRRLLPSGAPFWAADRIPMGPFPSDALDALDEMAGSLIG